jgi:hypothetical protein
MGKRAIVCCINLALLDLSCFRRLRSRRELARMQDEAQLVHCLCIQAFSLCTLGVEGI